MGTKQKRAANFEKIQKPLNYQPRFLLDRKGNPNGKRYLVEDKEDGLRGFIIVRPHDAGVYVEAYTSSGVKVVNAKKLRDVIRKAWLSKAFSQTKSWIGHPCREGFVLDGEFLCKNWNDSNSAVKTQEYIEELASKLVFKTWTVIPLPDWDRRKCRLTEIERKSLLTTVVEAIDSKKITQSKYQQYNVLTDAIVQRDLKVAVGLGKEGLVIKERDGLYLFKKCRGWMKLKPYYEADMTIIDAEEEKSKAGKLKNSLGAVIVKGVIDNKKIKTRVGGGYKRKDRIDLWKMHKKGKLVGKVIEMKHEGLTINNALRFPRFTRMRWDKEKAGNNE